MSCTPESACNANNTCAVGYQDERCSKCCNGTKGSAFSQCFDIRTGRYAKYYRPPNVAECIQCPDLAWLYIVAYVLTAIICALFLLWLTQKREINFAGLRIAVDYYQVLSMFAGLKVKWPAELRALWRAASTANLDPDITAPGCSVDVTYETKWFVTETVPLSMIVVLLLLAGLIVLRDSITCSKCRCKVVVCSGRRHSVHKINRLGNRETFENDHGDNDVTNITNPFCGDLSTRVRSTITSPRSIEMATMQNAGDSVISQGLRADEEKGESIPRKSNKENKKQKDLKEMVPGLVGACVSIMYYLYLLLVRGSFEIFDCETIGYAVGKDGVNRTVKALTTDGSIECGSAVHNSLVFPATVAMLFYGFGIPIFFGTVLWRHRKLIVIDQNLRCLGEGYSWETNPAYEVRRKYQRIYQHFRPHAPWWGMVIFARKFILAACTLLLRENPRFQVTVALAMLFTFFCLQVRYQPYMMRSALPLQMMIQRRAEGHQLSLAEARVVDNQDVVAAVDPSKLKISRRLSVSYEDNGKAVARNRNQYVFDYNVLESSLLVCGIFLLLAGLVFNSAKFDEGTPEYTALIWIVICIVAGSTLYCLSSVFNEMRRSWKYSISMHKIRKIEANLKALTKSHLTRASGEIQSVRLRSGSIIEYVNQLASNYSDADKANRNRAISYVNRVKASLSSIGSRTRMTRNRKRDSKMSLSQGALRIAHEDSLSSPSKATAAAKPVATSASAVGSRETKVGDSANPKIKERYGDPTLLLGEYDVKNKDLTENVEPGAHYSTSRSVANSVLNTESSLGRRDPDACGSEIEALSIEELQIGLPPNWAVCMHEGFPYYYHLKTCEVQWTRPRGAKLPAGYSEMIDPVSGRTYYIVTTEDKSRTTWNLPSHKM